MSRPKAMGNPIRKEDEVVVVDQEEDDVTTSWRRYST